MPIETEQSEERVETDNNDVPAVIVPTIRERSEKHADMVEQRFEKEKLKNIGDANLFAKIQKRSKFNERLQDVGKRSLLSCAAKDLEPTREKRIVLKSSNTHTSEYQDESITPHERRIQDKRESQDQDCEMVEFISETVPQQSLSESVCTACNVTGCNSIHSNCVFFSLIDLNNHDVNVVENILDTRTRSTENLQFYCFINAGLVALFASSRVQVLMYNVLQKCAAVPSNGSIFKLRNQLQHIAETQP